MSVQESTESRSTAGLLGRVSLADLLTIANGICGMLVIATELGSLRVGGGGLSHGRMIQCAALIVLGSIFDVADGAIARWRGGSGMGTALDTMSDALTFGVAPATMLIAGAGSIAAPWHALVLPAACLLVAASMLRLARFASFPGPDDGGFVGLAMPGAAGAVIALVVIHPPAIVLLLGVVVISALMASEVRYPHPDRSTLPMLVAYWLAVAGALAGLLPVAPVALVWLAAVPAIPGWRAVRDRAVAGPERVLAV